MRFLKRMLRIPWTEKKSNETVLIEANSRRSLIKTIRKRQATFLGQVMRREKLEHFITTGKLDGKRGRGKQREKMMDGLKRWLGSGSSTETITAMAHRELWRNMIADASKHDTG
ncbi:eukaryotic translation initiation factor 3 subunit F [Elysia marginata]|uniref:Eukaryotic translation initiation factor 3 subunit F n=1 Tax=Elysia marginata TaxID=1093978 RepID=A0AAV4JKE8_9GAST|nr:eukaryotic translation initiation factor 3 subunit F [Elysia marginata]